MKLFLTSSPFVENADRALLSNENQFIDRIREALPPFPRCLFVCSSPERHDLTCRFGGDLFSAFREAGIFFGGFSVLDGENGERAGELVENSDLIVLAGGHVPTQNAFFQEIRLRQLLEEYDGVVMGISAGSMNSAEFVYAQPEEEGETGPDYIRWLPGLNLTSVNVLPHYQKVKDYILDGKRLFEDITYADSFGNEFFAIPDGSFFYQDENVLLLCGEGYRIANGILEHLTEDGEELDMAQLD